MRFARYASNRILAIRRNSSRHWGQFTQKEYDEAAAHVRSQIDKLHGDIVGLVNTRKNMDSMTLVPLRSGVSAVENLLHLFAQTITTTGPMSLSAYMRQCLTHPTFGYYTTRDPLDTGTGDFITSPEISSVFGEMIGLWLFTTWTLQNSPMRIRLVEFGPGRGTLMNDAIKVFHKLSGPKLVDIEINLIEASSILRSEQGKALGCVAHGTDANGFQIATTRWGNMVRWLDTEKDIAVLDIPNYIIAHEFFDALPIKSFQHTEHGWRELLVEHTPSVVNTQPKLPLGLSSESPVLPHLTDIEFHLTISNKETASSLIPKLFSRYRSLPVGTRIEICTEAEMYISKMASLIGNKAGSALIIDYGMAQGIPENSLRGIHQHKFVSPFYKPGQVDLSVDVDFENLIRTTKGQVTAYGPMEQGDWLHNAGIGYRVDQLIKSYAGDDKRQDQIYNLYRRLTDKDSMGKIYKFLCLMPLNSPTPPLGFS